MSKKWPMVKLGEVLRHTPRPVSVESEAPYRQIGIRSHGKGVFHKEAVSGFDLGKKKVFWMEPGDFVINIVFGWEGAVAVLGEMESGMIASHRFPTFRADESRLDTRFLVQFFKTPAGLDLLGRVSPGGAGRNRTLSKTRFLEQSIPLPPLGEQRRIVARIEELAEQIHEAKRLRKEAAEEAEALENSSLEKVFERLLGSGILAVPFDAACRQITVGHVSSMRHAYRETGIPFLRSQNVRKNRFEPTGLSYIASEFHDANPKSALVPGDIVIVRTGFVGVACVIPESLPDSNCADLVIVRPSDRLDANFATRFLNSPSGKQRAAMASVGSAQKHYNVSAMKKTLIPLPPLPEQRRIVAELDALQAEVDGLKRLQAETSAELDALLPAILDRAFKGEL